MPEAPARPSGTVLPGGDYTATENPDGTWNVLDVPIMGVLPEGEHGNSVDIDRAWLQAAVRRAQARLEQDAYLAPLHIIHHAEPGSHGQVMSAGTFLPRRVGKHSLEGQEIDVVFADFVGVPPDVYAMMRAGRLPYRSIEINDLRREPEIDSLALLDHEAPYFKFPMLRIGKEIRHEQTAEAPHAHSLEPGPEFPTVAFRAQGAQGGALLCRLEEIMSTEAPPLPAEKVKAKGQDEDPDEKMRRMVEAAVAKALKQKAQDDDEDEEKKKAKAKGQAPAEDEEKEKGQEHPTKEKAAASASASPEILARLAVLEDRDAKREKDDKVDELVDYGVEALAGYHVSDPIKAHLRTCAEQGRDQVDQFVKVVKTSARKDPSPDVEEAITGAGGGGGQVEPEEVLKFSNQGGEKLAAARAAWREWLELKNCGGFRDTLEEYLDSRLNHAPERFVMKADRQ